MMPLLFRPDEQFELDEHGQVNWHAQWRKELAQLQQATEEQEKSGADPDWFRIMLVRLRSAMLAPSLGPAGEPLPMPPPPPPHGLAGQPPNPGDVPVPVPVPMPEQP